MNLHEMGQLSLQDVARHLESNPSLAMDLITRPSDAGTARYDPPHIDRIMREEIEQMRLYSSVSTEHITQFVVKTVTDCNLRCIYPCYEYVDETWRDLPEVMPDDIVVKVGRRIGEYAARHSLRQIGVVFHGGEPLFMHKPEAYYDRIIPLLLGNAALEAPELKLRLDVQTNGILLRPSILDVFKRYDVGVGVSIDGPADAHDARRKVRNGLKGSHALVMKGLEHLSDSKYSHLARSLLCVVNIDADPLATDDFLTRHAPPGLEYISYILPYATHDNPPPQPKDPARQSLTPYADWLIPIFWRRLQNGTAQDVRLFSSIMRLKLGGTSLIESIGPDAGGEVVIRTNGSFELADSLRVTAEGATNTDMDVVSSSIDQVANLLRRHNHLGKKSIASECKACPILNICGGGHIASRYSTEHGFNNASVYCADLKKLIRKVGQGIMHFTKQNMAKVIASEGMSPPEAMDDHAHCPMC